jgi:uncharacterized damage-inducible protein DinB
MKDCKRQKIFLIAGLNKIANQMWEDKGFLQDDMADVRVAMEKLTSLTGYVREQYMQLSPDELLQYPAPGKWSKQQVLGHLVDSALNNLKRFTDGQFRDSPYVIIPYQQNELVAVNHYQSLPLGHVLDLWQSLNRQIIYVVNEIPQETLSKPVQPQYNQSGTQTLEWLICDYVAHMQHHLRAMDL